METGSKGVSLKVSDEQIKKWKDQYRRVFMVKVDDDNFLYARKPTRQELSYSSQVAEKKDAMSSNDVLLKAITLHSTPGFFENDENVLSAFGQLEKIIQIKVSTLEEL